MNTCAVCGAANELEAAFCGTCGARLTPPTGTPVGAAAESAPGAEAAAAASVEPGAEPSADDAVVPGAKRAAKARAAAAAAGSQATPPPTPPPSAAPPPVASPPPAAWARKPAAPPAGTVCPNCGTLNDQARRFCRKCATELHPAPPARKPIVDVGWVARFLGSAGLALVVVTGGALLLFRPASAAPEASPQPVALVGQDSTTLDLGLVPADPVPLEPLPADSTIQLVSYTAAAPTQAPDLTPTAPWWNSTVPRVPAVTQFDGGKLAGHNCTMASGAMLARLAFGIVTTGSQLRALQDDQDGSSSFGNLNQALKRGWGVSFRQGALSPLQFRALLYAGAGAIVSVNYGEIPVGVRLQESYTGGHVIYIDAFRPPGPDGPAAYYVMDPIGHTWEGYVGGWWPAEDVERAATARYNGRMATAWAFAGGVVPQFHKNLPFDAYPGASGAPGTPSIGDPMPAEDLPLPEDPSDGKDQPDTPIWVVVEIDANAYQPKPGAGFLYCLTQPPPLGCPIGIVGVFDIDGLSIPAVTAPPKSDIEVLYGGLIAPATYQIIFTAPPGSESDLWLWKKTGGSVQQADVVQGVLKGRPVSIATITLDPAADYSFMATAIGDGIRTMSSVGSLVVGK